MPLILTDTASVVVNDYVVRKPLREKVVLTEVVAVPESAEESSETGTIHTQVLNVSPKKVASSYRQDLLTSQK